MKKLLLTLSLLLSQSAFAQQSAVQIQSSKVAVNPARITNREVLVNQAGNDGLLIQIIAEQTNGTTDMSNTHQVILSISQIGEMTEKEMSFVIGRSMGLTSVERLSGGIYRVAYNDAGGQLEDGTLLVYKTIDARNAVNLVKKGDCTEFDICVMKSSITVKTSHAKSSN